MPSPSRPGPNGAGCRSGPRSGACRTGPDPARARPRSPRPSSRPRRARRPAAPAARRPGTPSGCPPNGTRRRRPARTAACAERRCPRDRPTSRTATTSSASSRASRKTLDELGRAPAARWSGAPGVAQPPVELLRPELHPVPEGLVAEHDLQRYQGDAVPVEHAVGEIGRAVGDHGHRPALRVRQPPVLGPHVVGLGGLHPSPARRIAKDGLGGVGVHMDLEDVRQ